MPNWLTTLFFILVVLSPTQLGKHFWFDWSLVNGVRVDYLAPTIYATDILMGLILIAMMVTKFPSPQNIIGMSRGVGRESGLWRVLNHPGFILWLMLTFLLLRSFFTSSAWLSVYWLIRYGQILLVAWATARLIKLTPAIASTIVRLLAVVSLGVIIIGILQVFYQGSTNWFWILGERRFSIFTPGIATISILGQMVLRPYSIFSHPNSLAGWLALITVMVRQIRHRVIFPLLLLATALTASRGAIIATALSLSAAWALGSNTPRLVGSILFAPESVSDRQVLIVAAWKMFIEHPWFGIGAGQFIPRLPDYLPAGVWLLQPVHNVFLLVLVELGVIPTALVVLLVARWWQQARPPVGRLRSLLPLLMVWLITGMVDHYWVTSQQNRLLLGIVAGACLGDRQSKLKVKKLFNY